MQWAKRHLNWTLIISMGLYLVSLLFDVSTLRVNASDTVITYLPSITYGLFIATTLWVLKQKGRGYLWFLVGALVVFLKNNRA